MAKQLDTDRQYLQALAARHGYIFCIKPGPTPRHSTGYWGPLEVGGSPQRALTVNAGAATNVESLAFAEDALAPSQVFGAVYDGQDPEPTPFTIEQSSQPTALARNGKSVSATLSGSGPVRASSSSARWSDIPAPILPSRSRMPSGQACRTAARRRSRSRRR